MTFSLGNRHLVPPEQKGIFIIRADGRGLPRWLGPASRDPFFRFAFDPAVPGGARGYSAGVTAFSPDGRTVVLTDLGPGPAGEEAVQIVTLDIVTGRRTQLTHLPLVKDRPLGTILLLPGTCCPILGVNGTIFFQSFGNFDGSNPQGGFAWFQMNRDGSGLKGIAPLLVALPDGRVIPNFQIVGPRAGAQRFAFVGSTSIPANPSAEDPISEVFIHDGGSAFLQLTNFGRVDTAGGLLNVDAGALLTGTGDAERVVFIASADPFGTNPFGTCQFFSIGTLGTGLRQLTHFTQPEPSVNGCNGGFPPECLTQPLSLDPATGTLLIYSSCDPFGMNPNGDQLFAIRPDGTGLRQLTHAGGLATEADGTLSAENIGPYAVQ